MRWWGPVVCSSSSQAQLHTLDFSISSRLKAEATPGGENGL
jgi:hypothetical protein